MGRKTRKRKTRDTDYETESDSDQECDKFIWSVLISDSLDALIDMGFEYRQRDVRFDWISSADYIEWVEDVLYFRPRYTNFVVKDNVDVESIVYEYINDIIDIMNLKNIPLVNDTALYNIKCDENDEETEVYDPVDPDVGVVRGLHDKNRAVMYLNYRIMGHFKTYFV